MRPSSLAVSSLVLFVFLSSVQGIRLEKSFQSAWHPQLHEEALMKNSTNGVSGDVIFCKGHCTGNSRKLHTATTATTTPASSTSSKSEDSGDNKKTTSKVKLGNQDNGEKQEEVPVGSPTISEVHDQYADIMEIDEMDYSPAKRKPPIHN